MSVGGPGGREGPEGVRSAGDDSRSRLQVTPARSDTDLEASAGPGPGPPASWDSVGMTHQPGSIGFKSPWGLRVCGHVTDSVVTVGPPTSPAPARPAAPRLPCTESTPIPSRRELEQARMTVTLKRYPTLRHRRAAPAAGNLKFSAAPHWDWHDSESLAGSRPGRGLPGASVAPNLIAAGSHGRRGVGRGSGSTRTRIIMMPVTIREHDRIPGLLSESP
jgi:hypothetical protein